MTDQARLFTVRRLGFTGTREGMTERQLLAFARYVEKMNPLEFHHGDCVGADAQAHDIVRKLLPACRIVVHPATVAESARAGRVGNCRLPAKPPLYRNRDIVDAVDWMVATPKEPEEIQRSGTWATIRYARRVGRCLFLVLP